MGISSGSADAMRGRGMSPPGTGLMGMTSGSTLMMRGPPGLGLGLGLGLGFGLTGMVEGPLLMIRGPVPGLGEGVSFTGMISGSLPLGCANVLIDKLGIRATATTSRFFRYFFIIVLVLD